MQIYVRVVHECVFLRNMTTKMPKNIKIIRTAFKVSLMVFCLSFVTQFYLSNRYAVKSSSLEEGVSYVSLLKKEVAQLEYQNLHLSSLCRVEQEAREMGFVGMVDDIMIIGPVTVATLNIL